MVPARGLGETLRPTRGTRVLPRLRVAEFWESFDDAPVNSLGKIAVVGSGAVGCFYGTRLLGSGQDVHFLVRSDLETVRERGLRIRSEEKEERFHHIQAHASTEQIGRCDLVIIGLKATANAEFERMLRPLLGEKTRWLTLQNGLGSDDALGELFGRERVLGGLCFVCLNRVAPGVVEHYGQGTLSIGALDGAEPSDVVAAFAESGVETKAVANLAEERWRKLVWNIPFNGLSVAGGGITVDTILGDDELMRVTRGLMRETIAAANALGFSLEESYADFQIERSRGMGPYRPSSLIDWEAGRPVEVDAIWAEPLRRARAAGVETPRLEFLTAVLRRVTI